MNKTLFLSLPLILSFAPACLDDEPTEEDYDDVAQAVGSLVANEGASVDEVSAMEDAIEMALGQSPLTRSGDGRYEGQYLGVDYTYDLVCDDADGATLARCDERTEEARLDLSWTGELDAPRYRASLARTGSWTLSGLQGDEVTFAGTGTFDVQSAFTAAFRPVERTFLLDYDAQYDGVTYDRATSRFTGGTIRYDVRVERTRDGRFRDTEASFDMDVTVVFDGDGTATVTVDGSRTYDLSLSDGTLQKS